jgi:ubiquinone/menaquinone biosynthesis C-methylase UbiE
VNFDRVAHVYDETRGLPEGVPEKVRDRIVAATGSGTDTRFLELGVGTGRIALPFINAGHRYTGTDISEQMIARLRQKVGEGPNRLTLVTADLSKPLPFADESFDVLIAVHVLHLLDDWRAGLREARRVTVPAGCMLSEYRVVGWTAEIKPIDLIEAHHLRMFSQTWEVADDVLEKAHRCLLEWASDKYGDLDRPVPNADEFMVTIARWPEK